MDSEARRKLKLLLGCFPAEAGKPIRHCSPGTRSSPHRAKTSTPASLLIRHGNTDRVAPGGEVRHLDEFFQVTGLRQWAPPRAVDASSKSPVLNPDVSLCGISFGT
ncbi:hypothetical protein AAFF_G00118520 [Aldrovandia affinis]|uniref:Uncharacterized protein n=1 Tax=Aldrovandia affinis TaxID=143900 RepID=A0AAD7RSW5_9TELE|nr:hypothetical protein AAFF_G00118520 [Aldrovandia affinis]